ncbi:hypothetical protein MBLNU13_g09667t1 [Cladosporium sp. NU13]
MGKAFFSGWELWQKLILGCGIALTICLGSIKLAHTHWKLHKYSAVAEKGRKEQALHREMSQKRRGPDVPRADEVPFGIRALERGVEVEGVWVPKGNTPEPSIHNESRASSIWDFMPKKAAVRDVEKQGNSHQERENLVAPKNGHASSESTISIARPPSASFPRSVSADDLSKISAARDGTAKPSLAKPVRSKHPPPSSAKYSGNPSLHRQSSTVRTFEGIEAVYRASTYLNPDARHGGSSSESYTQSSSGDSSSDSGPISSAAPRLLNQKPQARPRHHSVDFELLNSHRQSQAAETGQLTPKTRKPTSSVDLSGYTGNGIASSSSKDLGYFSLKPGAKTTSTPPSPQDNPSPPKVDAPPDAVRRSSIPDVTPSAQFVQNAPAMPRPASLPFAVVEVEKRSEAALSKHPVPSLPIVSTTSAPAVATKNSPTEQAAAGAVRPSFEKERRGSQVLRGHGSGFEILQPGSLPAMTPAISPPPEKYHAVPPVSLQKYARSRSRSSSRGSTGRKLQKKNRPLSIDL